jgi:hypothetical protein
VQYTRGSKMLTSRLGYQCVNGFAVYTFRAFQSTLCRIACCREARSLLAERLKAEEAIAFAETAGGFQRQPSPLAERGM